MFTSCCRGSVGRGGTPRSPYPGFSVLLLQVMSWLVFAWQVHVCVPLGFGVVGLWSRWSSVGLMPSQVRCCVQGLLQLLVFIHLHLKTTDNRRSLSSVELRQLLRPENMIQDSADLS